MAKTSEWHSKCQSDSPYHDETRCTEGNNIEARCRESGRGNRRKCKNCMEISG